MKKAQVHTPLEVRAKPRPLLKISVPTKPFSRNANARPNAVQSKCEERPMADLPQIAAIKLIHVHENGDRMFLCQTCGVVKVVSPEALSERCEDLWKSHFQTTEHRRKFRLGLRYGGFWTEYQLNDSSKRNSDDVLKLNRVHEQWPPVEQIDSNAVDAPSYPWARCSSVYYFNAHELGLEHLAVELDVKDSLICTLCVEEMKLQDLTRHIRSWTHVLSVVRHDHGQLAYDLEKLRSDKEKRVAIAVYLHDLVANGTQLDKTNRMMAVRSIVIDRLMSQQQKLGPLLREEQIKRATLFYMMFKMGYKRDKFQLPSAVLECDLPLIGMENVCELQLTLEDGGQSSCFLCKHCGVIVSTELFIHHLSDLRHQTHCLLTKVSPSRAKELTELLNSTDFEKKAASLVPKLRERIRESPEKEIDKLSFEMVMSDATRKLVPSLSLPVPFPEAIKLRHKTEPAKSAAKEMARRHVSRHAKPKPRSTPRKPTSPSKRRDIKLTSSSHRATKVVKHPRVSSSSQGTTVKQPTVLQKESLLLDMCDPANLVANLVHQQQELVKSDIETQKLRAVLLSNVITSPTEKMVALPPSAITQCRSALVGMEYIYEVLHNDRGLALLSCFVCKLCGWLRPSAKLLDHLLSAKHRFNALTVSSPTWADEVHLRVMAGKYSEADQLLVRGCQLFQESNGRDPLDRRVSFTLLSDKKTPELVPSLWTDMTESTSSRVLAKGTPETLKQLKRIMVHWIPTLKVSQDESEVAARQPSKMEEDAVANVAKRLEKGIPKPSFRPVSGLLDEQAGPRRPIQPQFAPPGPEGQHPPVAQRYPFPVAQNQSFALGRSQLAPSAPSYVAQTCSPEARPAQMYPPLEVQVNPRPPLQISVPKPFSRNALSSPTDLTKEPNIIELTPAEPPVSNEQHQQERKRQSTDATFGTDAKKAKLSIPYVSPTTSRTRTQNKVVYLQHIPSDITDSELLELCTPFGKVANYIVMKAKNSAMVEYITAAMADALVNHSSPLLVRGCVISCQYSTRYRTITAPTSAKYPHVIKVTLAELARIKGRAPNSQFLFGIFKNFGEIERIATFRGHGKEAYVEFLNAIAAQNAIQDMNGKEKVNRFGGTPYQISVEHSEKEMPPIVANNNQTIDYRVPPSTVKDCTVLRSTFVNSSDSPIANFKADFLYSIFAPFGEVLKMIVATRSAPISPKVFVQFSTPNAAQKAQKGLNMKYCKGCRIDVTFSRKALEGRSVRDFTLQPAKSVPVDLVPSPHEDEGVSCNVLSACILNANQNFSVDFFYGLFKTYGEVVRIVLPQKNVTYRSKALVEFSEPSAAQLAIKELDGKLYDGHKIVVQNTQRQQSLVVRGDISLARDYSKQAEPIQQPVKLDLQKKVVHLRQVPLNSTDEELMQLCAPFGKVRKIVNLSANSQALVEYGSPSDAAALLSHPAPLILKGKKVVCQYSVHSEVKDNFFLNTANKQPPQAAISAQQLNPPVRNVWNRSIAIPHPQPHLEHCGIQETPIPEVPNATSPQPAPVELVKAAAPSQTSSARPPPLQNSAVPQPQASSSLPSFIALSSTMSSRSRSTANPIPAPSQSWQSVPSLPPSQPSVKASIEAQMSNLLKLATQPQTQKQLASTSAPGASGKEAGSLETMLQRLLEEESESRKREKEQQNQLLTLLTKSLASANSKQESSDSSDSESDGEDLIRLAQRNLDAIKKTNVPRKPPSFPSLWQPKPPGIE